MAYELDQPDKSVLQPSEPGKTKPTGYRVWIGILAAILIHQTICAAVQPITEERLRASGDPTADALSSSDVQWFLFWFCATALLWYRKRPRAIEWALPFSFFFGMYVLAKAAGYWENTRPFEEHFARFSECMYYVTGVVWVTGMVLSWVRSLLGEGKQQAATIRKTIGWERPAEADEARALVRGSSRPIAGADALLRPAVETADTSAEELLRPSKERSDVQP
jgi:hypothetical protein